MTDIAIALVIAALVIGYIVAEVVGNMADGKVSQRAFLVRCGLVVGLMFAAVALSGCATFGSAPVYGEIPECERLIPASLKGPVQGVAIPDAALYPDGHEKAEPWQLAFLGQAGQLEKANERAPAVDHIYRECLALHREALRKAKRGFFGRLFG